MEEKLTQLIESQQNLIIQKSRFITFYIDFITISKFLGSNEEYRDNLSKVYSLYASYNNQKYDFYRMDKNIVIDLLEAQQIVMIYQDEIISEFMNKLNEENSILSLEQN